MKYWDDPCAHAMHEYGGSLSPYGHDGECKVDVYFLDLTGGHTDTYHGACIRYGHNGDEYLSYAEVHYLKHHQEYIWDMYLKWCELRGKKAQDLEWVMDHNRKQYNEEYDPYGI